MAAIKRRDTKPERVIRSLLHAAGKRYRLDLRLQMEGHGRGRTSSSRAHEWPSS
ncbi:hypothetical protein [Streptomyces albogriseolus]